MSREIAVQQTEIARRDRYDDSEMLATIKQTVCKGATDAQFRMFIEVCRSTGLNPFLKEIWYVAEKGIIMAARDGYLRVANENPQFDGIETRVEREGTTPVKAVCTVWRKDRSHPVICEAFFNEYYKQSPVWKQYPSAMIAKVAEVLALKRSFAINGVVSEEEIGEQPTRSEAKEAQMAIVQAKLAGSAPLISQEDLTPLDAILMSFTGKQSISDAFGQLKPQFCKLFSGDAWTQTLQDGQLQETDFGLISGTIGNAKKCFRKMFNAVQEEMAVANA